MIPFRLVVSFVSTMCILSIAAAQDLSSINSSSVVMQSKVSYDGSRMVFIANYDGRLKPYISVLDEDSLKWGRPELLFNSEVTAVYSIRYPQLNIDHSKVFFSAMHQDSTHYDIYVCQRTSGGWSKPELVPMGIETSLDEMGPAVSSDERKILFTRAFPADAKADEYCYELYLSVLLETGTWSEAEPLGPAYNTGCVQAPYFARDSRTFFYSSEQDVDDAEGKRVARNQLSIFWAKISGLFQYNPKPLLQIIGDEDISSFSMNNDSTIYYTVGELTRGENRLESRIATAKIGADFQPESMTFLSGYVKNEEGEPIEADIQVIDPYTTKIFQQVRSDESGYYQLYIPYFKQFSVLAFKQNFSTQSKLIQSDDEELSLDFELFSSVDISFNVFDQDFYFPINSSVQLLDKDFNLIKEIPGTAGEKTAVPLGKELNVVLVAENYFPDTVNLPFDKEVIFDFFDFDIELKRKLKDVSLSFTDEEGNNLGLEITVYNVTRNEKTKRVVKDGKISLQLRDGEIYEISTSAEGYSYYNKELNLTEDEAPAELEVSLNSIENISLVLNNITFDNNSYELNAGSYNELENLITYLNENAQYKVEISAHTDNSGGDAYNLKLSNLRANSVLQYLQDNSINKDRLIAIGYGESQPLVPNNSEENMAKNRRVEFKILVAE